MVYYFGFWGIILCIIHNQEAKLIENFQEENVIVFQLQNDGKGKWNNGLFQKYPCLLLLLLYQYHLPFCISFFIYSCYANVRLGKCKRMYLHLYLDYLLLNQTCFIVSIISK